MTTFPSNGRVCRLAMLAAVILITAGSAIAQKGRWTKGAPFPEPSQEIGGTAVGGRIVILGGLIDGQIPKAMVWQYDSATDKWQKMKDMPRAGHHLATAAYNGKLYVFGGGAQLKPGGDTWVPVNNAWEYDLDKDSWRALAPMPKARRCRRRCCWRQDLRHRRGRIPSKRKKRRTSV